MTSRITIANKIYDLVKTRVYSPVAIYKSDGEYLRIGPKSIIAPELALHKKLLNYDFPVPGIITEGEFEGNAYYTEESLGNELLGDIFWNDCKQDGCVSSKQFKSFLNISENFALAQLKTSTDIKDDESLYIGIHLDYIIEELPDLEIQFMQAFQKLTKRTAIFPTVLTHGDFNAYNLFNDGVIDFGSTHSAPAGYDLVGNIYHTYLFPCRGEYESMRRYDFTVEQITAYFASMDNIYRSARLAKLTDLRDDYIFAKTVWLTTRMARYPKLQNWRYEKLKLILNKYLNDEPLALVVLTF